MYYDCFMTVHIRPLNVALKQPPKLHPKVNTGENEFGTLANLQVYITVDFRWKNKIEWVY